ncbi:MAG TPA: aromatic ring-hydroxylating dioxygenase subunit alpha [Macromonas sp.]|nr:aromatic ring-hydroxylating dioxygenase subunit alpha [Macromonas sp.]
MSQLEPQIKLNVDEQRQIFRVPRSAFTSQEVFEAERDEIFSKCWLYVGHASEVVKPGQFVTRSVGGRNLIFVRDSNGEVKAWFNSCPHRGATVCRERTGTAKSFQCFYHGWVFGNDGKMKNLPGKESYPSDFNQDGDNDLVPVPRLEQYRGLYFVNYDKNAVDLPTYLGNAKEYLDLLDDQSAVNMEVVGGAQEYSIRANWKLLVENSFDGYHAATTHATYLDYIKGAAGALGNNPLIGVGRDLGNGHGVVEYTAPWGRPIAQWVPAFGEQGKVDLDNVMKGLVERFGEERAERIGRKNRNLLIFPNLVVNDIMAVTIRTFYPLAPDYMNINAWALAPSDESQWQRKCRLENFLEFLGPGGFATPDDVEALQQCQAGYQNQREASWNDISKGMGKEVAAYDDEEQMRAFWRQWYAVLAKKPQA